ncbi:hypothetical protein I6E10_12120 [Phocaeicola barnesiae]|uniref:fimbrial protein n=1 Tax=Phocaeicola barnesiae TaxID=376804 RepID=UPI001F1663C9|nr:fimbrial protein [Phocaeicola barnesiae]MCF2599450.1 hypothetical protein [Phocaeicola barnesiae]
MIKKYSIYNWLFYPLLTILLIGGIYGCSNEQAMEEGNISGKSTLSIMVRGITTAEPSTGGSYEDYVKTLRVIGYDDAGTVICNEKYEADELGEVKENEGDTYEITQDLEDAFQGGVCDFYFIANENYYYVYDTGQKLSEFLENANLTKSDLEKCNIAFGEEDDLVPDYPILMTVHSTPHFLKPGDNVIDGISLIRCLARIQLKISKDESVVNELTASDVTLNGTYPDSYSLWNTGTYTGYQAKELNYPLTNNSSDAVFTSQALYFPEKLGKGGNAQTDTDLKFSFTLTEGSNSNNYEVEIGEETSGGGIDYDIHRNHWYTTMATYYGMQGSLGITFEVEDWKTKPYKYELSDVGTFTTNAPNARSFEYETGISAIATQYSTEAGASSRQATFIVEMKTPVGVRWMAHLTNAQDFEIVTDENHAAEGVGGSSPITLLIRPTKSFDATGERPYTELYVTLGTAPDNKQTFVNPGKYCSGSEGTSIPIVQVSASEWDTSASVQP